jgi:probable HAF family extracellular repeat protein
MEDEAMHKHLGALAVLVLLAALALPARSQHYYKTIDLGSVEPASGYGTGASAVNAAGQACGWVIRLTTTGAGWEWRAYVWDPVAGDIDLGALAGWEFSEATHINDAGQVCGSFYTYEGYQQRTHAFFWDPGTGFAEITLGGDYLTVGGLNSGGQVCGTGSDAAGGYHPFVWARASGLRVLGLLPGGTYGAGIAINEAGQVAGYSGLADGSTHACLWDPVTGVHDLGTLGGRDTIGTAINSTGQVCGWADAPDGRYHFFIADVATGIRDLGTGLGQEINPGLLYLNDAGQIAGDERMSDYSQRAFRWDPGTGVHELDTPWNQSTATGISQSGCVFGTVTLIPVAWDAAGGMMPVGWLGGDMGQCRGASSAGTVCGTARGSDGEMHAFLAVPSGPPASASLSFTYSDGANVAYGVLSGHIDWGGAVVASEGTLCVLAGADAGSYALRATPGQPYPMYDAYTWFYYDNVLWPGRDPAIDVFGLLFTNGTQEVNLWGNGPGTPYTFCSFDVYSDQGVLTVASTPAEQVRNLQAILQMLVEAGALQAADAAALQAKLAAAAATIARGNRQAAGGQLGALANQAHALVLSGRLEAAKGQSLGDLVKAATGALGR